MAETTDRGERHLRILVLHGLLDADEEPAKQLERLVSALYTVVSRADVVVLRWSPADPRRAMLAAARGTLGTRFAEALDPIITNANDSAVEWVVIAYSGGGWLFYEWAAAAPSGAKSRIRRAITIAAPWRMVPESNARFRNSQIVPLRPWSHLRPIDILSGLGGLLDVMLSADDDTVWPINARFPAHPGVVLHEVQGLDHWQIIEDDGILDYILEEVRKCLDA